MAEQLEVAASSGAAGAAPAVSRAVLYGWIPAGLFLATFAVFRPALDGTFVNWDDYGVILENYQFRTLNAASLKWMFADTKFGHYHPLTWLSYWLDFKIWTLDPRGFHLTNLVLHGLNVIALYLLLLRLLPLAGFGAAAFARSLPLACGAGALLFGIHPLRTESVAWISERRDVLSGFFYILCVYSWIRMASAEHDGVSAGRWYGAAVALAAASLLSKAWAVTLLAVLLVLDVFPLRRFTSGRRIRVLLEKIPFLILTLIGGAIAVFAQHDTEALIPLKSLGLVQRVLQASYGLLFYAVKTVVPLNLSPAYLLLDLLEHPTRLRYVLAPFAVLAAAGALFMARRRYPHLASAFLIYAAVLSPVLGLFQSGPQLVADRYSYLACIPIAVLGAAALLKGLVVLGTAADTARARMGRLSLALAGVMIATFGMLAHFQSRIWFDGLSLWNHAIRLNPENHLAYGNRAMAKFRVGLYDDALADCDRAIGITDRYDQAYMARALIRSTLGNYMLALADLEHADKINTKQKVAAFFTTRAQCRIGLGDFEDAIRDADKALTLDPGYPCEAYATRGQALEGKGDLEGALADYRRAIEFMPDGAMTAYTNRGMLWLRRGEFEKALEDFSEAIRIQPGLARALRYRGLTYRRMGRLAEALRDFDEAVNIAPYIADLYHHRGVIRGEMQKYPQALADFERAIALDPRLPDAYANRGGTFQALGMLPRALRDYEQALAVAPPDWPGLAKIREAAANIRAELEKAKAPPAPPK